jgi:hypothetical protein
MFARSQWAASNDRAIQADAQEVLDASEALLQEFQERKSTYRQWGSEACALLSRLNSDIEVSPKRARLRN